MPHVQPGFQPLLESQMRNCQEGKDPRGRRWDPRIISVCLGLYSRSPKSYDDLKNSGMLILPSGRLLTYYKNFVDQRPGFNSDNLVWMSKEADRRNVTSFGRRGGLLLDEMQIQEDLQVRFCKVFVL